MASIPLFTGKGSKLGRARTEAGEARCHVLTVTSVEANPSSRNTNDSLPVSSGNDTTLVSQQYHFLFFQTADMFITLLKESSIRFSRNITPVTELYSSGGLHGYGWARYLSSISFPGDKNNNTSNNHNEKVSWASKQAPEWVVRPLSSSSIPDFEDYAVAFRFKTTRELLRAAICFRLCRISFLVDYAEEILDVSKSILGTRITDSLLKATLYGHFCVGENPLQMAPIVKTLESSAGIGTILDYAAEQSIPRTTKSCEKKQVSTSLRSLFPVHRQTTSRSDSTERDSQDDSEQEYDLHTAAFQRCIHDSASLRSEKKIDPFVAIKVTALANPTLLGRMSTAIAQSNLPFRGSAINKQDVTGRCVSSTTETVSFTDQELKSIQALYDRAQLLAETARAEGIRLLVDAEETRVQPAIDHLVSELQQSFNAIEKTNKPIIFNTYQCYLKDTSERLRSDVEHAQRFKYHFGAKLVRGAYMESERTRAATANLPSPIHDSIEQTHACYNQAVEYLLEQSIDRPSNISIDVMCATHNQQSIEKAIAAMDKYGVDPSSNTVCFAQLYGMCDHLSYNLGRSGYRAFKYVPYGEVQEVIPYLIRRARENSSITGGCSDELERIKAELRRRLTYNFLS